MPTVFIVDDDVALRESLEYLVASSGWRPEVFGSAEEFLARPRKVVPGCLILDVGLPELSGLELQKRIGAERGDLPSLFQLLVLGFGPFNVARTVAQ